MGKRAKSGKSGASKAKISKIDTALYAKHIGVNIVEIAGSVVTCDDVCNLRAQHLHFAAKQ